MTAVAIEAEVEQTRMGPVGLRVGLWHLSGFWVPAVVIGSHERLGLPVVKTVADPNWGAIMARQSPNYFTAYDPNYDGCELVVYPEVVWRHASECEFVRITPATHWTPPEHEFEVWEPWP
jgi:hypothetical protein